MIFGTWLKLVAVSAVAIGTVACVIDSDPPHRGYNKGYTNYPPSSSSSPAPSGSSSSTARPAAILVPIDTDKTMDADPGEGVGIFTEYKAGGHWHVWLSCDTNQTQKVCPFDVRIRVETGKFSKVEGDHLLDGDSLTTLSDGAEVQLKTSTSTAVAGAYLDTAPGDVIQITGAVGGVADSSFFFFVQDGKVNGGYDGKLTNPLRFQGTKP
jgi:hypothetical protein